MKGFKPTGYGPSDGFKFPTKMGFTGSTGSVTPVAGYTRRKHFADGGFVRQDRMSSAMVGDTGNACVRRARSSTNVDQEYGGKSPLRPGFKDGGANWIAGATKNKGALHRALHVPEGAKIPAKKLAKAANSSNPTMRKRAALAKTLKGMHKADGGGVRAAVQRMRGMGAITDKESALAQKAMSRSSAPKKPPATSPAFGVKEKFYDGGGKVQKQPEIPAPSYWQAFKDRAKEMVTTEARQSTGLARKAAEKIENRSKQIDAASNYSRGGKAMRRCARGGKMPNC